MSWEDWLNEYVCWDIHEDITRRLAIYRLCKYGLIPLLETNGYRITITLHTLCSRIATGMYNNRAVSSIQSDWNIGETENPFVDNKYHRIHYNHVLSTDTWDHFWSLWGLWHDVDSSCIHGWDRQNDISEFMWTQINLEESSQMQVVNEMLGIEEGEEGDLDMRDTYVRDMTEYIFH